MGWIRPELLPAGAWRSSLRHGPRRLKHSSRTHSVSISTQHSELACWSPSHARFQSRVDRNPAIRMLPRHHLTLALCCALGDPLQAAPAALNVDARPGLDLDGKWHVIVDPYDAGYYDYRHRPLDP